MSLHICKSFTCTVAVACVALAASTSETQAVVISGGLGQPAPTNNTAPTDDPGWNRTGSLSGGTAVYLGNGWVLTANHVGGFGSVNINGTSYAPIAGTGQQLLNPDNSVTDLYMYKIDVPVTSGIASLPVVKFAESTPSAGDSGIMIGTGFVQNSATADHNHAGLAFNDGYTVSTSVREKKWGGIEVITSPPLSEPLNFGLQHAFFTQFSVLQSSTQAASRDSGSPAFFKNGDGEWVLGGLAHFITGLEDQAANTAVDGNMTIWSDLSVYKDQITAIIPEPASLFTLAALVAPLATLRRRRA